MARTKYGEYVKSLSFKDYGPGLYRQGTEMNDDPDLLPARAVLGRAYLDAGEAGRAVPHLEAALPTDEDGIPERYAIESRFGSVAQAELMIGAPNDVGVRQTFLLQPPAENSYVYNELEPIC